MGLIAMSLKSLSVIAIVRTHINILMFVITASGIAAPI